MRGNYETVRDFVEKVAELEQRKQDYIVPSRALSMGEGRIGFDGGSEVFEPTNHAHGQIAQFLGLPKAWYEEAAGVPSVSGGGSLRDEVFNSLLGRREDARMVRTINGTARAFLSDRYRPIDNYFVLDAAMPTLQEIPGAQVMSQSLTDTRMYVQVTFPSMEAEVRVGDVVRYGITLTNSEVGAGAVDVRTMIWRLSCMNGAVAGSILRRNHVGAKLDMTSEATYEMFKDDTIQAELSSLRLRLRDVIAGALGAEAFEKHVGQLKQAAGVRIEQPAEAVRNVTKRLELPESWVDKMLGNMVEEGNLTQWGLVNAITWAAQQEEDRDRQFDYEVVGGKVMEMSGKQLAELVA